MRRTTLGLALSTTAHAGVAVWLAWSAPRRVVAAELLSPERREPRWRAPEAPEVPDLAAVPPESLLELAIVELPEPAPADVAAADPRSEKVPEKMTEKMIEKGIDKPPPPRPPASPIEPDAPPDPQIATRLPGTTAPGSVETAAPSGPTEEPTAPSPSRLSMRGAVPTRLLVPDLRKIAESGAGTIALAPVIPVTSDELDPAGRGRKRSDQGAFVAEVARDGTVRLKDKPNLQVHLAVPSPRALGRGLARWYEDPYAQTRDRERERERQRVPSGAVDDEEEQRKRPGTVPIIGGSFDLTDWAMRLAGRDPYWAAKLAFLDRTREARAEMATAHRAELLRNVVGMIRAHLARAWAAPDQSAAQRRRALFELWDDCAESGDPALVEAATSARTAVLGFIRAHLPAGSPDAYPDAELAALNRARQSHQAFAPYQDPPAAP